MIITGRLKDVVENIATTYLKIIKDLTFKDYGGRRTCISTGDFGFVLNEEEIFKISNASSEQKAKMIKEMMECYNQDGLYALVCGYPCILMPGEYELLASPPHRCCAELM